MIVLQYNYTFMMGRGCGLVYLLLVCVIATTIPSVTVSTSVGSDTNQPDDTTTSATSSQTLTTLPIVIIAGAAGGGGLLLLVLIILIILYACRCGCFREKTQKPSLWQTDLPLTVSVDDPATEDIDTDRGGLPKNTSTQYQNVTLMSANELNPRLPPLSEPDKQQPGTPKTTRVTSNGLDTADTTPSTKNLIHAQNKDLDIPRSPGISSLKPNASSVGLIGKEDTKHLGEAESDGGTAPVYGEVKKPNRPLHGSKKKEGKITAVGPEPWISDKELDANYLGKEEPEKTDEGNVPVYGEVKKPNRASKGIKKKDHENTVTEPEPLTGDSSDQVTGQFTNPVFDQSEYAEIPEQSNDPTHNKKPKAMVKPIAHTPKPPVPTKPGKDRHSSSRTNTQQAPPAAAKKPNIKKFQAKSRPEINPSTGESSNHDTPLQSQEATTSSSQPPAPPEEASSPPLMEHHDTSSVDGHREPHEAQDDHDVLYANLDFQSTPSDTMPQPEVEQPEQVEGKLG